MTDLIIIYNSEERMKVLFMLRQQKNWDKFWKYFPGLVISKKFYCDFRIIVSTFQFCYKAMYNNR